MKLSTRSRYGLRLMVALARHHGHGPIDLAVISREEALSMKYLSQIIIPLRGSNLVRSMRGKHGGYLLAREPQEITAHDVLSAIEGDLSIVPCIDTRTSCSRSTQCPTRLLWERLNAHINETLAGVTLVDLCKGNCERSTPMYYI